MQKDDTVMASADRYKKKIIDTGESSRFLKQVSSGIKVKDHYKLIHSKSTTVTKD